MGIGGGAGVWGCVGGWGGAPSSSTIQAKGRGDVVVGCPDWPGRPRGKG